MRNKHQGLIILECEACCTLSAISLTQEPNQTEKSLFYYFPEHISTSISSLKLDSKKHFLHMQLNIRTKQFIYKTQSIMLAISNISDYTKDINHNHTPK